jgi:hypothetical protein
MSSLSGNLSKNLIAIEQHFNFKYPPSFLANVETIINISQTPAFAQFMPQAQLLLTLAEVKAANINNAAEFLPFLLEKQPNHVDFYGFDTFTQAPEFRVAVFAKHAFVEDWDSFAHFLAWLQTNAL